MKTLLRQPLLHFAALGAAIFLLSEWIGAESAAKATRRILIDDQALREFVQYRSRSYDAAAVDQALERLSAAELKDIIDELIREEALHRQAEALNLGANDYVIRRRLVQKMEFIAEGSAALVELRDGDAERHYERNPGDYHLEPTITFAHVFFDPQRRGVDAARALAETKKDELNQLRAPLAAATRHGDRFLYHVNYVERTPEFVASHFGAEMATQLFSQPAQARRWRGPFESEHGFHLALIAANNSGRLPEFAEVAEQAARDARRRLTRKYRDAAVQAIIDRYDVHLALSEFLTAKTAASEAPGPEANPEPAALPQTPTDGQRFR